MGRKFRQSTMFQEKPHIKTDRSPSTISPNSRRVYRHLPIAQDTHAEQTFITISFNTRTQRIFKLNSDLWAANAAALAHCRSKCVEAILMKHDRHQKKLNKSAKRHQYNEIIY
jgi:hypothetical protein